MHTLTSIKHLRFTIHYEIVEEGYTLHQLWEIERHDETTTDSYKSFCWDVLEMLNSLE